MKIAFDWSGAGQEFRRQLPGFHPYDAALGAAVGAGGGAVYDQLKGHDDDDRHSLLRRMAVGAGIGGFGMNLAGDRARRYISNVPGVGGYDADQVKRTITGQGLKGLWRGAVLDRKIPFAKSPHGMLDDAFQPDKSEPDGWSPSLSMRREFMRRGMGVHTDDAANDYFQPTGTIKTPDGRSLPHVQLSERFTDPATGLLRQDPESLKVYSGLFGELGQGNTGSSYPGQNASDVLGSYSVDHPGNNVMRARDYFDYALEPQNRKQLLPMTADVLRHPSHWNDPLKELGGEMRGPKNPSEYDKGDFLKSMYARLFMNNVIGPNPPVFDTTLRLDDNQAPVQQFSGIAHDQGFSKDDSLMSKYLAPYNR